MRMYTNRTISALSAGLIGMMGLAADAQAKIIKCWENDLGIRECGATVPPEHAQKRIEYINERGLIVKIIPAALSKEELAQERARVREEKEKEAQRKEQARQDAILLNAYTTERDLLMARDNNLKSIDGQIDISKGNLKVLRDALGKLQQDAGHYERSGKKPPEKLVKEIEDTKAQISTKEQYLTVRENERKTMEARFDENLQRFRKLKGLDSYTPQQ